jgi:hypothetical protein
MNERSKNFYEENQILLLDFYNQKALHSPKIALIFLPPYSPEVNSAEKFGGYLRRRHQHESFPDHERFVA